MLLVRVGGSDPHRRVVHVEPAIEMHHRWRPIFFFSRALIAESQVFPIRKIPASVKLYSVGVRRIDVITVIPANNIRIWLLHRCFVTWSVVIKFHKIPHSQ